MAAFLACSWTWCIGMFLPVLLVRDYGPIAWVIFAVPNIVGAAAMGWVLSRPDASARFLARHAMAAVVFSTVTIAFHVYFVIFLLAPIFGRWTPLPCLAACIAIFLACRASGLRQLLLAGGIFVASIVMMGFTLARGQLSSLAFADSNMPATLRTSAVWLVPACCFGFLLCPYLDLTFHRARQSNGVQGARIAFGFGFGVLFLLMILFTLCYANPLAAVMADFRIPTPRPRGVLWIVLAHLLLQTAYTVALHLREITPVQRRNWRTAHMALLAVAILLPIAVGTIDWQARYLGFPRGELGYRLFMVFYALVFPAYVYLCAIPSPGGNAGPTRAKLALLAAMIAICLPLFGLAFIFGQLIWLGPAITLLVAARWVPWIQPSVAASSEDHTGNLESVR